MKDELTCKWCDKSFRTERTLAAHMCPRKRRWADRDMTHVRLAYRTFQMFYEMNTNSSKPKSMEDFIRSQYYEGFTKFGRSCIRNEYMDPEKFAEWLIREGKKLQDWNKDQMYNDYLLEFVKKEPGMRALERTITYFATWAEENDTDFNQYFRIVSANRAVHDIRSARVSPWVLHLSESGVELLGRMNNEQVEIIKPLINVEFWVRVFMKSKEETDEVEAMCIQAGL
jgi:hypothetical protein